MLHNLAISISLVLLTTLYCSNVSGHTRDVISSSIINYVVPGWKRRVDKERVAGLRHIFSIRNPNPYYNLELEIESISQYLKHVCSYNSIVINNTT